MNFFYSITTRIFFVFIVFFRVTIILVASFYLSSVWFSGAQKDDGIPVSFQLLLLLG